MSFEHSLNRGVFFGFIPHKLELKDRSDLDIFPLNVMFMQYKVENGKTITGKALYEPDLESFKKEGEVCSMEYHNVYGGKSWLIIEYDCERKGYVGKKNVNEKSVGMACGTEWSMFFAHFTALGLTEGERCEFEDVY